jgi:hypothetical protein
LKETIAAIFDFTQNAAAFQPQNSDCTALGKDSEYLRSLKIEQHLRHCISAFAKLRVKLPEAFAVFYFPDLNCATDIT